MRRGSESSFRRASACCSALMASAGSLRSWVSSLAATKSEAASALIQASRPSSECLRMSARPLSRPSRRSLSALSACCSAASWASRALLWAAVCCVSSWVRAASSASRAAPSWRPEYQSTAASSRAAAASSRASDTCSGVRVLSESGACCRPGSLFGAALILPPVLALGAAVVDPPGDHGVDERGVGGIAGDQRATAHAEGGGELHHAGARHQELRRLEVGGEAGAQHALQVEQCVAAGDRDGIHLALAEPLGELALVEARHVAPVYLGVFHIGAAFLQGLGQEFAAAEAAHDEHALAGDFVERLQAQQRL